MIVKMLLCAEDHCKYCLNTKVSQLHIQNMRYCIYLIIYFLRVLDYHDRTYTPTLEDVGAYLALYWVPTRADGEHGEPLITSSSNPVSAGISQSNISYRVAPLANSYLVATKYYPLC